VLRRALLPVALVLGGFSLAVAHDEPAFSFAGSSTGGSVAFLGAGWALVACGLLFWGRHRGNAAGPLLVAAGFAWFLGEWDSPGVGSAPVFTVGLVFYASSAPLAAWAVLAYPTGRLASRVERVAVGLALAGALLVLGLLPALVYDPATFGCSRCADNLLLVADEPARFDDLGRLGIRFGLAWSLLLIAVAAWRAVRSSRTRQRVVALVVLAGCAYLGLVAAAFATSLERAFVGSGDLERRLWLGQSVALTALAAAVGWSVLRARRTRSSLARLVVELGESPPPGRLREGIAETLADPAFEIAYPIGEGRYVDARGRPVGRDGEDERAATPLVREGRTVALLLHRSDLLDNPELIEEVASAARLALENERLQAEARAQLEDLRLSRTRIIEAGDAERRRLERDLHDGAQQRLVGLSLALRLMRSHLGTDDGGDLAVRLDTAESEIRRAIVELRDVAHGIHPAVLTDEGLAAALEALAEEADVRLAALPQERFPAAVETAAYILVAEAAKRGAASASVEWRDGALVVEVETEAEPDTLVELQDRIGALDGRLRVARAPSGGVRLHAEIPCA
jgi:signal transduction histidine kinase